MQKKPTREEEIKEAANAVALAMNEIKEWTGFLEVAEKRFKGLAEGSKK